MLLDSFGYFYNAKKMCTKQEGDCFSFWSATSVIRKTCFQNKQGGEEGEVGLLFSLLSNFCNRNNVCLRQVWGCSLVH